MASRTVKARVMVEGEEKYKQSMQGLAKSNESLGSSAGKLGDQVKDLSGKLGINLPDDLYTQEELHEHLLRLWKGGAKA